jgi:hypothetical protein
LRSEPEKRREAGLFTIVGRGVVIEFENWVAGGDAQATYRALSSAEMRGLRSAITRVSADHKARLFADQRMTLSGRGCGSPRLLTSWTFGKTRGSSVHSFRILRVVIPKYSVSSEACLSHLFTRARSGRASQKPWRTRRWSCWPDPVRQAKRRWFARFLETGRAI